MEGLEKLEKLQRTIESLHSLGISDPNPHSERFLAHFASFLMDNSSDQLDIAAKCQLITTHISKVSSLLREGKIQCSGEEEEEEVCSQAHISTDDKSILNMAQSFPNDTAVIGMDAMRCSNSTLEDFCRSYFMFHNMEAKEPQSIFRYLPVLSFTESYIYQLDGLNENLLPRNVVPVSRTIFEDDDRKLTTMSAIALGEDPFRPLLVVLERHGLVTPSITEELKYGEEYWALERKLCCALARNERISVEDITRAIHLKSFDYRVLNLLLYQLRGEKVNNLHMDFLSISELLVEVSDDLFDYEDDVVENNFNILRMFVKHYGASTAPIMLAKFIAESEEKYDELSKALDPELWNMYRKRCEEATKEGGKTIGPSLGTWQIPPVIENESAYRTACSTSSTSKKTHIICTRLKRSRWLA